MTSSTDPYKLKARNLIPGWPRGKSTGGLGMWPQQDCRLPWPWLKYPQGYLDLIQQDADSGAGIPQAASIAARLPIHGQLVNLTN